MRCGLLAGCFLASSWMCSCAPQVVTAIDDPPPSGAGTAPPSDTSGGNRGGAADRSDAELPDAAPPDTDGHGGAGGLAPVGLRGDALIHRYSFNGTNGEALDAKGAAHGSLIGARLTGKGSLTLDGAATLAQYVDLPNQLVSGLGDATFEIWMTWAGGAPWQRIIDFGEDLSQREDARSVGRSYLFLSPRGSGNYCRVVYRAPNTDEIIVDVRPALSVGVPRHVAIVFDDSHDEMSVYVDGALSGSVAVSGKLSQIPDVNDWLGRSQFAVDPGFSGTIDEFRIYDQALSSADIARSMQAGPDAIFPEP